MQSNTTLWQGDCLELMKDIPDKSIDMILCDLPYGTTRNKWDSIIPLDELWAHYGRVIKDNGAIVLTAQTPFDKVLGVSNMKFLRYEWIWQKSKCSGYLNAKNMPLKQHENILVFYKKLPTYNPQGLLTGEFSNSRPAKASETTRNYGKERYTAEISTKGNYPKSIQYFSNPSGAGHLHPTQKPVALFEYLIKTYTNEGEVVLDNCMGSGTAGVACVNTGRNFIGIELDKGYFNIAQERIEAAQAANGR